MARIRLVREIFTKVNSNPLFSLKNLGQKIQCFQGTSFVNSPSYAVLQLRYANLVLDCFADPGYITFVDSEKERKTQHG